MLKWAYLCPMNRKELFLKFNHSEVYLEPNMHVYVHKETGEIFNSVTTALHLFDEGFDGDDVINGLIKQYEKLTKWYRKNGGREEELSNFVKLFSRFSKKRPYTTTYFRGQERKSYKDLSKYSSIQELVDELTSLKKEYPNSPQKGCYLHKNGQIMTKKEIFDLWDDINILSRHYGHIIHESIEYKLLCEQGICFDDEQKQQKLLDIKAKSKELEQKLDSLDFGVNNELFNEYILKYPIYDYIDFIYLKFCKMQPDMGKVAIPEKVMYSKKYKITGTCDLDIVYDEKKFKIGDHKTNKEFNYTSQYNKKLSYPFDDMDDCEYSKYTLQLNTYGHIQQEEYDREFLGSWITFFNRTTQEFEHIDIPYQLNLAKKLLDYQFEYFSNHREKYLTSGILDGIDVKYHTWLTKVLNDDISERKKKGMLFETKKENREFYKNLINEKIHKLESTLKNRA